MFIEQLSLIQSSPTTAPLPRPWWIRDGCPHFTDSSTEAQTAGVGKPMFIPPQPPSFTCRWITPNPVSVGFLTRPTWVWSPSLIAWRDPQQTEQQSLSHTTQQESAGETEVLSRPAEHPLSGVDSPFYIQTVQGTARVLRATP